MIPDLYEEEEEEEKEKEEEEEEEEEEKEEEKEKEEGVILEGMCSHKLGQDVHDDHNFAFCMYRYHFWSAVN